MLASELKNSMTAKIFTEKSSVICAYFSKYWGKFLTWVDWVSDPFAQVALHGVAGCVSSEVGGGKCGPGALSAAFSKTLAVNGITSARDPISGTIVSSVAGGTASVLGGGKFANGAVTGAFSYLFNCLAHVDCGSTPEERSAPVGMSVEGATEWTLAGQVAGKLGPLGSYAFGPGITFDGIVPVDFGFVTDYSLPIRAGASVHFGGLFQISALSGSMLSLNGTQSMSFSGALGPLSGNFGLGMQTGPGGGNLSGVNLTWSPVLNVGGAAQAQVTRTFTVRGVVDWFKTKLGGSK